VKQIEEERALVNKGEVAYVPRCSLVSRSAAHLTVMSHKL
jgi:hypothetical protein